LNFKQRLETDDNAALTYSVVKRSVLDHGSTAGNGPAALNFLTNLAMELSRGPVDLPCFPNVVIRIRDALNNPRTSVEETVKLVGAEPRLAARLIQTANSVAFNPTGARVTELRTAITRLGQQLVQGAAMAFAVQCMKDEPSLRSIAKPLQELWKKSIAVASICQVVARHTKIKPDEAFLVGLLHGIGRLYIMAKAVGKPPAVIHDLECEETIVSWHASIGKAVLENWRVGEAMAESVGKQCDYSYTLHREPDLTDVLIVSIALADALEHAPQAAPPVIDMESIKSFGNIGLTLEDCLTTLRHTEYQLGSLHDALGC
jgi:HD-like signal output (HDOD) protein